jgi:hypothetical protein
MRRCSLDNWRRLPRAWKGSGISAGLVGSGSHCLCVGEAAFSLALPKEKAWQKERLVVGGLRFGRQARDGLLPSSARKGLGSGWCATPTWITIRD